MEKQIGMITKPTQPYIEWDNLTENQKEGRRFIARELLNKFKIRHRQKRFTVSELIDIKEDEYDYHSTDNKTYQVITDFISILIKKS